MQLKTRAVTPYLYLLPTALLVLFIYGYPLVKVFDFSLRRVRGITGDFVGLQNYLFLSKDPIFRQAVVNNLRLFVLIPFLVALALLFAFVLFGERIRGRRFFRPTARRISLTTPLRVNM